MQEKSQKFRSKHTFQNTVHIFLRLFRAVFEVFSRLLRAVSESILDLSRVNLDPITSQSRTNLESITSRSRVHSLLLLTLSVFSDGKVANFLLLPLFYYILYFATTLSLCHFAMSFFARFGFFCSRDPGITVYLKTLNGTLALF